MSTRYAVSLIGPGYRLVEPEVVFPKKKDAVAYATAGLARLGVFDVRVRRDREQPYVRLFETDPETYWAAEDYVFHKRRNPTAAEMDEARRDARERAGAA